ncbi:Enhanced intracellular survival protein [Minicystis rosea]|nr:Enhanced intracellular survival protein [Minicystis rosea]
MYIVGMSIEVRTIPPDHIEDLLSPIATAFGMSFTEAHLDRARALSELDVRLGAYDGDALVGAAGSYSFDVTVPGGAAVPMAGLTLVAVVPTHRRRGILTRLMRTHLDGARARGQALAGLFASEAPIYGRFGYGMAAVGGDIDLPRDRTAFFGPPTPPSRVRFVTEAEALTLFPPIWDRVRRTVPGMLTRSPGWWHTRRIADPDVMRGGRGPLQRVIVDVGGRPAAYALYRFSAPMAHRDPFPSLEIAEAMGDSPEATRAVWRYLLDIDLASSFRAAQLPVDHPLMLMLADPRRLYMRLRDTLWIRLVDVGAALSQRRYGGPGSLTLAVEDAFCPWNEGRYRLAGGAAERTDAAPDLAMNVADLGAAYLGGTTFTQLAAVGRVIEHRPGALLEADAMFRSERVPWCPETF